MSRIVRLFVQNRDINRDEWSYLIPVSNAQDATTIAEGMACVATENGYDIAFQIRTIDDVVINHINRDRLVAPRNKD